MMTLTLTDAEAVALYLMAARVHHKHVTGEDDPDYALALPELTDAACDLRSRVGGELSARNIDAIGVNIGSVQL